MKILKSDKTGEVVWRIDEKRQIMTYVIHSKSSQLKHFNKIEFRGFNNRPSGVYAAGYGLTKDGQYLLRALVDELGEKFNLTFIKNGVEKIRRNKKSINVAINYSKYSQLLAELRAIRADKNNTSKQITSQTLARWFPKKFKSVGQSVKYQYDYEDDKLSKIFSQDKKIVDKLSKNDVTALLEIYPALVKSYVDKKGRANTKLLMISGNKAATDKVILGKLIEEFEAKLKHSSQSENSWQVFLQEHILLFNTSYVAVLGKASVALQGKYPDFMLVDVFNYIDIFEIKKPSTNLLKLDESRNNYFWDNEISKAISQVENYINSLSTHGANFSQEIRKIKGLDVSVVRPRGVIIAGIRSQLKNEKMKDDFRLLRNSLSNIDVILFDDFLDRLKNLQKRLSK